MKENSKIFIKGARANNLKNVSVEIPKDTLVVITGVSGSGKSSLTIDTLYAEGQRRYVESLSSYARQFLMRMKKPEVDYIKGICPAIAVEQKVSTRNARSTVGTLTEIYDYLRLLFARVGRTFSPVTHQEVKKHAVSDVVDYIHDFEIHTKIQLFAPLAEYSYQNLAQALDVLVQKGFNRIALKGELVRIEEALERGVNGLTVGDVEILIDRFMVKPEDEENIKRIADSVQLTFNEGGGNCIVDVVKQTRKKFNNRFELDGMEFEIPTPHLFNFNNPYGACPTCEGYGQVMGIDENKVVPDPSKSVLEGAIACWRGEKLGRWRERLIRVAHKFDFPVHRAYNDLTKKERKLLWTGNSHFKGINAFFEQLEEKAYKIQNRVMLSRYRGKTRCPDCDGARLRPEAEYVKIDGHTITDFVELPIRELVEVMDKLQLTTHEEKIAKRLLLEVRNRLDFMLEVGLSYLTLSRLSATLSGGETQRINLTRMLGSNLTSSLYILDEPSVGLHPRDTARLVNVLKALRDLGNTVVVVEHEEDVIANSDYLIDVGPNAGIYGGEIVFAGPYESIQHEAGASLTAKYMNGAMEIPTPKHRRPWTYSLEVKGAQQHNLKKIDVTLPLQVFSVVTGVSGSGKTSLVKHIIQPALKQHLGEVTKTSLGLHESMTGDLDQITQLEFINQNPIGKSSRSNPVTYVKAYDAIRKLFAGQPRAQMQGFKPKHFSFNVEGGRCETCKGEGETVVSMQFLADVRLVCEDCNGKRFKKEVLEVQYKGRNIFEILDLSVDEALEFFENEKDILKKLQPLQDVGLGYVKLGQSSSTLSGGEAQRVKLASFLGREDSKEHIFFIFDEPTTGLHFHDIQKLLAALNALVEAGHTVMVVEHNLDVIKSADYVIDLGPDGGKAGGNLVFQGTPEALLEVEASYTGHYLKEKMND